MCRNRALAVWPRGHPPHYYPPTPRHLRSFSTSRITDLLLKAAFGTQASDSGSTDSLQEKPMEIAPSAGFGGTLHPGARGGGASSPAPVVFTVGSPPSGTTPPQSTRTRMFSGKVCAEEKQYIGWGFLKANSCCVTVLKAETISCMKFPACTCNSDGNQDVSLHVQLHWKASLCWLRVLGSCHCSDGSVCLFFLDRLLSHTALLPSLGRHRGS